MATILNMLSETEKFMMSFVIETENHNLIVIDGGRPCDMPKLKEYTYGKHISAWILTHAHDDHISGFLDEMEKNCCADFDLENVYCNFPPYEDIEIRDVPDYEYRCREFNEMLPSFYRLLPRFENILKIPFKGDSITIDECRIDFLYHYHRELVTNPINDSSLVFKLTTPNKTVLFLGDLGPDGGDVLFRESRHLLKSDIVQMAHHGHMNVGMEVYAEIMPKVCLWSCEEWLYNEPVVPHYLSNAERLMKMGRVRMYGTALTRKWMELLGVKKHYVTKDGDQKIII